MPIDIWFRDLCDGRTGLTKATEQRRLTCAMVEPVLSDTKASFALLYEPSMLRIYLGVQSCRCMGFDAKTDDWTW